MKVAILVWWRKEKFVYGLKCICFDDSYENVSMIQTQRHVVEYNFLIFKFNSNQIVDFFKLILKKEVRTRNRKRQVCYHTMIWHSPSRFTLNMIQKWCAMFIAYKIQTSSPIFKSLCENKIFLKLVYCLFVCHMTFSQKRLLYEV